MSAGHTPLPWHAVRNKTGGFHIDTALGVESTNGYVIADNILGHDEAANAAFIVRACNSHYELLEALDDLFGAGTEISELLDAEGYPKAQAVFDGYLLNARAAIAKACADAPNPSPDNPIPEGRVK